MTRFVFVLVLTGFSGVESNFLASLFACRVLLISLSLKHELSGCSRFKVFSTIDVDVSVS